MALTKVNIVDDIQKRLRYPRGKAFDIIETLIEIMKATMEKGDDVLVSGFGKFCVRDKEKRKGRNPATGKTMMLNARRVVTFKCSKQLRDKVNGKLKKPWWHKTLAEVEIRGLCSFFVKQYKGYKGRNPKTGKIVTVNPKKLPFFKCGMELRKMVNKELAKSKAMKPNNQKD